MNHVTEPHVRAVYDLHGIVQGVGFRPAVYRLAQAAGLSGWVQNRSGVVRLVLEGPEAAVAAFMESLPARLPPNARLERIVSVSTAPLDRPTGEPFHIVESGSPDSVDVTIPADLRLCDDCQREVLDPADRRYGYPFTTCTRCGPRYTVVTAMPYDRERTTLTAFPLCPACQAEYENPADRRFHAESIACPVCGPRLETIAPRSPTVEGGAALRAARAALAAGRIVAVRGLGGYLLAVDAFNRESLRRLRDRKQRPHKPFAVMARDLAVVRQFCEVSDAAAALLESAQAPIVILDVLPLALAAGRLPLELLSPDTHTLGVMLPTTPLHRLLTEPLAGDALPPFDLLVMTSGNRRGEPIALTNAEARERLDGIADVWVTHNREIMLRNDDSVAVIRRGIPQVWRRARGFAPNAVALGRPLGRTVLALGADMKNAVALGFGDRVVLSPHVGDLDTPEALDGLEQVVRTLPAFLAKTPEAIAIDRHPDMRSAALGRRLAAEQGLPVVEVQHHHAHAAACLAEHGLRTGLALVMDGTGWGDDETIWGAELLDVGESGFRRVATFAPAPLPGGEAAIRQPARQLVARWAAAGVEVPAAWWPRLGITEIEAAAWAQQARRGPNAPASRAAGRLFDAFAAVLGVAPRAITYEGQPAIRLEALARECRETNLPEVPFLAGEQQGMLVIDWSPAFRALAEPGAVTGREAAWALAFHKSVGAAILQMIRFRCHSCENRHVALTGGVMMNRILNDLLTEELGRQGVEALVHRMVPPGDGCIALGQAVVAGG